MIELTEEQVRAVEQSEKLPLLVNPNWTAPFSSCGVDGSYRDRAAYSSGGRSGNAGLDAVRVNAERFQSDPPRFRVRPSRLGIATLVVALDG